MSDFKSKLPSLHELTHIAGKLFKDVKNSVSEIIDEYKQKRKDDAKSTDDANSGVSSNDGRTSHTSSTTNDIHHGTMNQHTKTSTGATASSSSTQPINATVEAQTVDPVDELIPTDAGVGYQSSEKKPTKRKQKTAPLEDNLSDKVTTKPSKEVNSTDVDTEPHVDKQKPLKDDVL